MRKKKEQQSEDGVFCLSDKLLPPVLKMVSLWIIKLEHLSPSRSSNVFVYLCV